MWTSRCARSWFGPEQGKRAPDVAGARIALSAAGEEAVRSFLQAAEDSTWFDGIALHVVRVRSACALKSLSAADVAVPRESLDSLVADESAEATQALAEWVAAFSPSPVEVYPTMDSRIAAGQRLVDPLRRVVADAASTWSPDEKASLLEVIAEPYVEGQIDDSVVRAFALADAEPARAGKVIVSRYGAASNNDERERVMDLWNLVNPTPDSVRRDPDRGGLRNVRRQDARPDHST